MSLYVDLHQTIQTISHKKWRLADNIETRQGFDKITIEESEW